MSTWIDLQKKLDNLKKLDPNLDLLREYVLSEIIASEPNLREIDIYRKAKSELWSDKTLKEEIAIYKAQEKDLEDQNQNLHPCIEASIILQFEQKIKHSLPSDYKNFLLYISNGGIGPGLGLFSFNNIISVYCEITGLTKKEAYINISQPFDIETENKDLYGLIPIGYSDKSEHYLLAVTGQNAGWVYILFTDKLIPSMPFASWYNVWLEEMLTKQRKYSYSTLISHQLIQPLETTALIVKDKVLDNLLEGIGEFENLLKLTLYNNALNYLPDEVKKLQKLQKITLDHNYFEKIPEAIYSLVNLLYLYINYNKIKYIDSDIKNLIKLKVLSLSENAITSLPDEINVLENLNVLILSNNRLTTLPDNFYLKGIQELYLDNNKLEKLPDFMGLNVSLAYLDLRKNKFTELPECISNLVDLECLHLDNNGLTELPENIIYNKKLKKLTLSNNKIDKITIKIGSLKNLEKLDIRNNHLDTLPATFIQLHNLKEVWAGGNPLNNVPHMVMHFLRDKIKE